MKRAGHVTKRRFGKSESLFVTGLAHNKNKIKRARPVTKNNSENESLFITGLAHSKY